MINEGQKVTKRLRGVMRELSGVVVTLDALAKEGRSDRAALEMLSRVVDDAFASLDEIADSLDRMQGESEGDAE